jgi:hypothetical protein
VIPFSILDLPRSIELVARVRDELASATASDRIRA